MDISITQKRERRFLRQYANFGLFSSPPFVVTGVPAAREVSRKRDVLTFLWRIFVVTNTNIHSMQALLHVCIVLMYLLCTLPVTFPKHMHSNHNFFTVLTHFQGCELGHLKSDREKMLKILNRVGARWQPSFS